MKKNGKHWIVVLLLGFLAAFPIAIAWQFIGAALANTIRSAGLAICLDLIVSTIQGLVMFFVWVKLGVKRYKESKLWNGYLIIFQIIVRGFLSFGNLGQIDMYRTQGYVIPNSVNWTVAAILVADIVFRVLIYNRIYRKAAEQEQEVEVEV